MRLGGTRVPGTQVDEKDHAPQIAALLKNTNATNIVVIDALDTSMAAGMIREWGLEENRLSPGLCLMIFFQLPTEHVDESTLLSTAELRCR